MFNREGKAPGTNHPGAYFVLEFYVPRTSGKQGRQIIENVTLVLVKRLVMSPTSYQAAPTPRTAHPSSEVVSQATPPIRFNPCPCARNSQILKICLS